MPEKDLNKDYSELISRYLSGNASDAEVQTLENWVMANPDHKQQFIAYKKAWMLTGIQKDNTQIDVDKLWEDTSKTVFTKVEQDSSTPIRKLQPKQNRRLFLQIAATIALLAVAGGLLYQNWNAGPMVVSTDTATKTFDLPDQTKINLNHKSTLTYSIDDSNQRKVNLKGNAFFDVQRDEKRPFIIEAADLEVEVLGTSFYVDAREKQSEIQVIVESGSVAVRKGNLATILKAGEKAIFNKANGQLLKADNDDPNFNALKTKRLVFDKTPLSEVVFALNRQFNTDITIESEVVKQCKVKADYNTQNLTLDAILKILEATLGISSNKVDQKIILSGTICK